MTPTMVAREIALGVLRHKVRAFLVFSTFALGFASVLVTVGAVEGERRSILETLEARGPDLVAVMPKQETFLSFLAGGGKDRLELEEAQELRGRLGELVRLLIPMRVELGQVDLAGASISTTVVETPPELFSAIRVGLLEGRPFGASPAASAPPPAGGPSRAGGPPPREVVIDEALAREFRPDAPESLVGEELEAVVAGRRLRARVAGVLRDPIVLRKHMEVFDVTSKARLVSARRLEFKNLYVPFDESRDSITLILAQLGSLEDLEEAQRGIEAYYEERGKDPLLFAQKEWIGAVSTVVERLSIMAHFFWILNLVVVLILSSTIAGLAIEERFGEIAIRRVEGATVGDALLPIVAEGLLLAALAIPAGWGLSAWIHAAYVIPLLGVPPRVPSHAWIWMPILFLLVGFATYWIPGRRVARCSPVSVLARHG